MSQPSIHLLTPFRYAVPAVLLGACLYSCAPKASAAVAREEPLTPTAATTVAGHKPVTTGAPASAPTPTAADNPYHFEKPKLVRGIYLTAWSAASPTKMEKMMGLMDRTELNAVVIDVRDTGDMYFKTGIPLAAECGANQIAVSNPKLLMERLAKHHVWPIARIACFRDNWVPKKHPELAVQTTSGAAWHDRSGHYWLDPYNKKNWDYIAKTVDFALDAGFPEIQLDYVRFPSEGKSNTQVFPGRKGYENGNVKPVDVIPAFAKFIGDRVHARGATFSADIFGIISSTKKDEGIGQSLEKVSAPFDLVSPMIYPSHFAHGEYGIPNPNTAPYEIIHKSLADYKKRIPTKPIRPWLQDFSLFGVHYGAAQVRAQIKAAHDLGYDDFLLWNAGNHYTEAALDKDPNAVASAPAKAGSTKKS